jgi:uncharacterized membrane protein YqaE (UPF0057 family)
MDNEIIADSRIHSGIHSGIQLKYQEHIIQTTINNNYDDSISDTTTIEELFTTNFAIISKESKKFYICNGKLINPKIQFSELKNDKSYDKSYDKLYSIECFDSLNGGEDFLDLILKPIEIIFSVIFKPIGAIGNVFIFLLQLIIWLIKFIYWFLFFIAWLFSDLLNPVKLISDFWNSIVLIIVTIFSTVMNVFMGIAAVIINSVGGWMQGFWGWDQSGLTKNDKNSNYFKGIDRVKGKKCYLTNNNTVPFSILLGTILCPPIGVFMDLGLTGWFNILICAMLTLVFYFPGLIYALILLYC